ncbi:MAG: asparagine synthase (glutamine-hydrolyzing) [Planctomycetes bacterium]|nr:asparagine synthase (glutamine-hydrolyzing) [Planctomycetota bacterium]
MVFNGCIYNHRELRRELEAAGHVFTTDHSDTEVLVHGWRQWGADVIDHLDGMYAVAIWDAQSCSLVVFRDPFGEKPLYTLNDDPRDPHDIAFASTPAALVRLQYASDLGTPGVQDARHVAGWIQFGWAQGFTTLRGITGEVAGMARSLISAKTHTTSDDDETAPELSSGSRWLTFMNDLNGRPTLDAVDHALREAVHSRIEADVPIGCFLSGGIDSALVTRYAAEKVHDLTAFTVRMPSAVYDESEAARQTAACLDIRHEILDCQARPASDLVELIHELGLPFGDSSLLPSLWVNRAARQTFKVALTGDGGDELFLGYDRHRALALLSILSRLPAPLRRTLANHVSPGRSPRSIRTRASRLLAAAGYRGYKELTAIFPTPMLDALGFDPSTPHHDGLTTPSHGSLGRTVALRFDRAFYLPEDLLRKSDTASMHVALEARAPMLARGIVEQVINASVSSLMPNGQRKGLLRRVARRYFPPEIVDRPKMGFAIPIGDWFRNDFGSMRQLLYDHLESSEPFGPDALGINGMINMDFVRRMLREHDAAGEKSLWPWHGRDHSQRLYMLLVMSIWAKWLGGLGRTGD